MAIPKTDILIIGAGLTGLTLAYLLRRDNLNVTVLEARSRLGGRIYTKRGHNLPPIEMGATWLGHIHTRIHRLLDELGLQTFKQRLGDTAFYEPFSINPPQLVQIPPNENPSFRIQGGTDMLINKLASFLQEEQIRFDQVVRSIHLKNEVITVQTTDHTFEAGRVISTLPPYLFQQAIDVQPQLPNTLLQIAKTTHTWMGDSIKVGLAFRAPFWRAENSSGTIFSNVGPVPEMYDHANQEDTLFALKGFFNGAYYSTTKEDRLKRLLAQLRKYYKDVVDDFLSYEELVWKKEIYTSADYSSHILPHQNNGHSVYQEAYLDGRLYFGGAETSIQFPGYMEGAIRSAEHIYSKLQH